MLHRQTLIGLALGVTALLPPCAAKATPGQTYLKAIAYLRAQADTALSEGEAQAILLGEAVAADPLVLGPRSTTELSSLELASADPAVARVFLFARRESGGAARRGDPRDRCWGE